MMYADELDLPRLVRSRLAETGRSTTEVSREAYGNKPGELSLMLSGTKSCSVKAFLNLVCILRVEGEQLKLWVAAFLVARSMEFLPLVHKVGLVPPKAASALATLAPAVPEERMDERWKAFSRVEATGRLRLSICHTLSAESPLPSAVIATRLRLRASPVRTALRDLQRLGMVQGKAVRRTISGLHAEHKARVSEWSLTEKGEKTVEMPG